MIVFFTFNVNQTIHEFIQNQQKKNIKEEEIDLDKSDDDDDNYWNEHHQISLQHLNQTTDTSSYSNTISKTNSNTLKQSSEHLNESSNNKNENEIQFSKEYLKKRFDEMED